MILLIIAIPVAAMAQTEHENMDMPEPAQEPAQEPAKIPAGRPTDPDYKPEEKAADNSYMALVSSAIFGTPVALWFVTRSIKKTAKKKGKA